MERVKSPRVALIHEALPFIGGAERVLLALLELFPEAPVYTLVYNRPAFDGTPLVRRIVVTSFIDRLPGAHRNHRLFVPLYPLAVERFDLSAYDLVISCSYASAHGIRPSPGQLHLNYIFTPLRYAWHSYSDFVYQPQFRIGPQGWVLKALLAYLRHWDRRATSRVDSFVAISQWIAQCVWRAYQRPAEVIYPPVEVERFQMEAQRDGYYILVSRLVAHKRVDLVVEAFNRLRLPLLVVGAGGGYRNLAQMAGPNVTLLGWQADDQVASLLSQAKALVHAGEEDFGIALVEAQAAGCPVIAYRGGGASETVIHGKTGLLFPEQSVDCIVDSVLEYERRGNSFSPHELRTNALRFDRGRFLRQFEEMVAEAWEKFRG
ncbi:MAG TPA: glycosyltransferase [Anaerolineales bacterium]|nr:glycosyltransferase [Anaerolineales bacterium]